MQANGGEGLGLAGRKEPPAKRFSPLLCFTLRLYYSQVGGEESRRPAQSSTVRNWRACGDKLRRGAAPPGRGQYGLRVVHLQPLKVSRPEEAI